MERLEISTSRKKSILLLIGAILFVALGIWLLMNAEQIAESRGSSPLLIFVVGIAAIIFFGLGMAMALRRIIRSEIALVIDSKGLHFNPKTSRSEIIRWSDIIDFEVIRIKNTPIVIVHVRDPEAFVAKESNAFKRQLMKMNINQYQSPFNIASAGLTVSHSELLQSLNTYHDNFRLQKIK